MLKLRIPANTIKTLVAYEMRITEESLQTIYAGFTPARSLYAGLLFESGYTTTMICEALNCTFQVMIFLVDRYFTYLDGTSTYCLGIQSVWQKITETLQTLEG